MLEPLDRIHERQKPHSLSQTTSEKATSNWMSASGVFVVPAMMGSTRRCRKKFGKRKPLRANGLVLGLQRTNLEQEKPCLKCRCWHSVQDSEAEWDLSTTTSGRVVLAVPGIGRNRMCKSILRDLASQPAC